jgi:trigger factor
MRKSLQGRVANEQAISLREQAAAYLMEHTTLEVPAGQATRHAGQVLRRRIADLMQRGITKDQIERDLQELEVQAIQQAGVDLKLSFILGRIAELEKLTVEEGEVNSRIAEIAREQNRRPERMRQEMAADGTLEEIMDSMRDEKALDEVLKSAKIVDITEEEQTKLAQERREAALAKRKAEKKKAEETKDAGDASGVADAT